MIVPRTTEIASLRFALTREEFVAAHVEMLRLAVGRKARAVMVKWAAASAAGSLACAGWWVFGMSRGGWAFSLGLPFSFAVFLGALAWMVFRGTTEASARARAEKVAHGPMFEDLLNEHSVTLSTEGFAFEGGNSSAFNRWRLFESAELTESFLVLTMADRSVRVIPRRVLADAEAAARECAHWIAADGGGEQRSVVAHLRAHDTPCPKCQYQLRGLARAQCPECGTVLGRENLPQAFG